MLHQDLDLVRPHHFLANARADIEPHTLADARAHTAPVRGRLARLRQERGRRLLSKRCQLHLRLQKRLLGERGPQPRQPTVTSPVHTRDSRANGDAYGVAHAQPDAVADVEPDRDAYGIAHAQPDANSNARANAHANSR